MKNTGVTEFAIRSMRFKTCEASTMIIINIGDDKLVTLSKKSPASSSSPGMSARMNAFVIGRIPAFNGK